MRPAPPHATDLSTHALLEITLTSSTSYHFSVRSRNDLNPRSNVHPSFSAHTVHSATFVLLGERYACAYAMTDAYAGTRSEDKYLHVALLSV